MTELAIRISAQFQSPPTRTEADIATATLLKVHHISSYREILERTRMTERIAAASMAQLSGFHMNIRNCSILFLFTST
jgi:hypothetical protein